MKKQAFNYPWLSAILLLFLAFYLYLCANQDIAYFYKLPQELFNWQLQLASMAAVFLSLWLDTHRFHRHKAQAHKNTLALHEQIKSLSDSKKQLQTKAHTYSGQADKLKLFISDKLLEYIEYDEKFLHFKGIAAEVRHNGIICYDKILTSLQQALQESDSESSQHKDYAEALTSLSYLWDLLDLSTADNIALHINNHICECEEYYYQAQLQDNAQQELAPYSPTFFAHQAILRAVQPLMTEQDSSVIIDEGDIISCLNDKQFQFNLATQCELLGNENHLVLIIENLLKNALFYSGKGKTSSPQSKRYHRVALLLSKTNGIIELSIYNHGPHIADDIKDHIFQLGYTTRRAKEQHGRGLGLYFVNEIVKGYEGKISQHNINNVEDSYSIRIELESSGFSGGEVTTHIISTHVEGNLMHCINCSQDINSNPQDIDLGLDLDQDPTKHIYWKLDRAIKSVEITPKSSGQTHCFSDLTTGTNHKLIDPNNRQMPRWAIEINAKKRSAKVSFIPLDITGVAFNISLPCAETQFNYEEDELHNANDDYINGIEDKFKSIDA